jgi:hypothetical protein
MNSSPFQFLKDERMSLPFVGKKGAKAAICLPNLSIPIFIGLIKQKAEHFRTTSTKLT